MHERSISHLHGLFSTKASQGEENFFYFAWNNSTLHARKDFFLIPRANTSINESRGNGACLFNFLTQTATSQEYGV